MGLPVRKQMERLGDSSLNIASAHRDNGNMSISLNLQWHAVILGVIFFIYTLSGSEVLSNIGLANYLEYLSEGSLVLYILIPLVSYRQRNVNHIVYSVACMVLLSLGLLFQGLSAPILIRLLASLTLIVLLMTSGNEAFKGEQYPLHAAWGVFAGLVCNYLIAVASGTEVVSVVAEQGLLGFGFNCGMKVKNFAAITAFAAMSVLVIYSIGRSNSVGRMLAIGLLLFVIVFSSSRTTQIITGVFFFCIVRLYVFPIIEKRVSKRLYRIICLLFTIILVIGVVGGILLITKSSTYAYRFRGLVNYLGMFGSDWFHMVFGNAKMAFGNPEVSYIEAVRGTTGWDGTVELPLLSVLIKNGLIGLSGYVLIASGWIIRLRHVEKNWRKCAAIALFVPLLICSLVENYVVNIHIVYMPLLFCSVWGFLHSTTSEKCGEAQSVSHPVDKPIGLFRKRTQLLCHEK